jgi:hypothetical protein
MKLFEDDWGKDNSPIENVEITTTILYFSKEELKQFKHLCKEGMKREYGPNFQDKGNLSDLLLKVLNEKYGTSTQA